MKEEDATYVIRLPYAQRLLVARLLLDYTKAKNEEKKRFIDSNPYTHPIDEEIEVAYQALNKFSWWSDNRYD